MMADEGVTAHQRYAEAVERLNSLQSNMETIARITAGGLAKRRQPENMREMVSLLDRLELQVSDMAKLNFIHVSGTKGKGSVCAFTECLLRHRGMKTGFYSSPHLVEVRERIRINGQPLSKAKFVDHFWTVYNKLDSTKEKYEGSMPPYFRFLTLMGLHVFLAEAVDVAVMEVGIGGRFDCTNIIPAPLVCGITPLGYDHINVLGNTMEEIAWNKAGIMKPGCPVAVTWSGQPPEGMAVLEEEANKTECRLFCVPPLADYPLPDGHSEPPHLGIHGPAQDLNASMALQLAELWWRQRFVAPHNNNQQIEVRPFRLDEHHLTALASTVWPGRCSVVDRSERLRIHLDGAHTLESLMLCVKWFGAVSAAPRVLVFNVTGGRDSRPLLRVLQKIHFDLLIFCPNLIHSSTANQPDLEKVVATRNAQMKVCHTLLNEWRTLSADSSPSGNTCQPDVPAVVLPSVEAVLSFLENSNNISVVDFPDALRSGKRVDVLVTGSLHLVGNFYAMLQPDLNAS